MSFNYQSEKQKWWKKEKADIQIMKAAGMNETDIEELVRFDYIPQFWFPVLCGFGGKEGGNLVGELAFFSFAHNYRLPFRDLDYATFRYPLSALPLFDSELKVPIRREKKSIVCNVAVISSTSTLADAKIPQNPNPEMLGTAVSSLDAQQWCAFYGGEGGIRTLARVTPTNSLANCPLRPTWVLLHVRFILHAKLRFAMVFWRREWGSNPRQTFICAGFQDRCHKPARPSLPVRQHALLFYNALLYLSNT